MYFPDIDTPVFDYLNKRIVTNNFVLEPLGYKHFLDLFEFRMQNEPEEIDPFENMGERFEEAYTQFFTYICNADNLAWVLLDRVYIAGFFLLEIDVDYNNYMNRNAHLYYELSRTFKGADVHKEIVKAISDNFFGESDIPRIELHLDEDDDDKDCMEALEQLGYVRKIEKNADMGFCYFLTNNDPILDNPPRHMPYILRAYQNYSKSLKNHSAFN